jgi:hypothetical protein
MNSILFPLNQTNQLLNLNRRKKNFFLLLMVELNIIQNRKYGKSVLFLRIIKKY